MFSVNRFGSTYALSAATEQLNGSYVQTPQDVVVTETNPDALQNIRITLFKNNQTIILQEGTDYRIEVRGGNGQWYRRHLTSAETRRPVRPAAGRLITICRHIWRCMLGNGQLRIRKAVQNERGHFWNISQL